MHLMGHGLLYFVLNIFLTIIMFGYRESLVYVTCILFTYFLIQQNIYLIDTLYVYTLAGMQYVW
jgi:hypothetical protein